MSNYTAEGVRLIPDSTELQKDINKGHVGLAIGGGAPVCNSIYVVQVFENSPCALDGKIGVGDEIVAINGVNIRGFEKAAVADLIRKSQSKFFLKMLTFIDHSYRSSKDFIQQNTS